MTIQAKFTSALAGLSGCSGGTVAVDEGGKRLVCHLMNVNPLACEFEQLSLSTTALAQATMDELKQISDDLAARVTYLLEPIGPVEQDQSQCIVQMRSKPPQKGDDGTCYYELLVRRGGELSLCRYKKEPGDVRKVIPAIVTQEVLLRLVDDFATVAP